MKLRTMKIRDLPDEVYMRLKERARRNRRSLDQEVIAILSRSGIEAVVEERADRVEREIQESDVLRSRAKGFMTAAESDTAKCGGLA